MQIRTGDDIFHKHECPSRAVTPSSLSAPLVKTAGNEPGETENPPTTTGLQPERGPNPQQPHQQQRSSTLPPPFPPELFDHIVDHLHDDKQSLMQCSRVSRVFSHATSYHLFGTVNVPSVRQCVEFQELIRSSLHPLPSTSTTPRPSPPPSVAPTSPTSTPPASLEVLHQPIQSHHLHPRSNRANVNSHMGHQHTSAGWDISKFVRRIEFYRLDPQPPIEEYISEAVKLVRMLPRIREVVFGWWMQTTGLEKVGRAFATTSATPGHHDHPSDQPFSLASANAPPETRVEPTHASGPLKLHLDLVDFDSVHTFLDFLGSFGGRVRELSLASVTLGGGNRKEDLKGRFLPGLERVCLGYDAVVQPKEGGPTMGAMMTPFGLPAIDQTHDLCGILEEIAPNVSELQLFKDDDPKVCMGLYPEVSMLRLPRFQKLKSVTMYAPGPRWSDLVYGIAAWFARDEKLTGEIADTACQGGPSFPIILPLPSTGSATRADRWKTKVRFTYPVRKGDVDWRKLESAVLGEDFEGLDGVYNCAGYGNHRGRIAREGGNGVDEMLMKITHTGKHGAAGSCSPRFTAGSLWVDVGNGSAVLGEVRGELGRLDQLGLLQVSCW